MTKQTYSPLYAAADLISLAEQADGQKAVAAILTIGTAPDFLAAVRTRATRHNYATTAAALDQVARLPAQRTSLLPSLLAAVKEPTRTARVAVAVKTGSQGEIYDTLDDLKNAAPECAKSRRVLWVLGRKPSGEFWLSSDALPDNRGDRAALALHLLLQAMFGGVG
jgi:hypothetical protein